MKMTNKTSAIYGIQTIVQIIFFVIGLYSHDWFYLLAAFIIGPNLYRVINYEGNEND